MAVVLPILGMSGGMLGTDLLSKIGAGEITAIIPIALVFILIYFIIFTLVEIFQIIYFYDIFDALRKIKQKAWKENRKVTDGYSFGKKILVLLPVIVLVILAIIGVIQGFKQPVSEDNNLLNKQYQEFGYEKEHEDIFKEDVLDLLDVDSDNDGLSDSSEEYWRTDPNNPDTDGDGYLDGEEIANGYDPLIPGSARLDVGEVEEAEFGKLENKPGDIFIEENIASCEYGFDKISKTFKEVVYNAHYNCNQSNLVSVQILDNITIENANKNYDEFSAISDFVETNIENNVLEISLDSKNTNKIWLNQSFFIQIIGDFSIDGFDKIFQAYLSKYPPREIN